MTVPRIAWVSPLRDWTLNSVQCTRLALPHTPADCDLEIFTDSADCDGLCTVRPGEFEFAGRPVFHAHRIGERHRMKPFDSIVMHVEDALESNFARLAGEIWPGVNFVHDLNLNRLYHGLYRHTTAPTELNKVAQSFFGSGAPQLGTYHVKGWSAEIFDKQYSCGLAQNSCRPLAVVASCSAQTVLRTTGRGRAIELFRPMSVSRLAVVRSAARDDLRRSLGLDPNAFVFTFSPEHYLGDRVGNILDAFGSLLTDETSASQDLRLVWLIRNRLDEEVLRKSRINPGWGDLLSTGRVLIHRVAQEEAYHRAISGADAAIAVRYDRLRGMPRFILDCMAGETPVIAADYGPSGELPDRAVMKISLGIGELEMLKRSMRELAENAALRTTLSLNGARFVSEDCAPSRFWPFLIGLLENHRAEIDTAMETAESTIGAAEQALLDGLDTEDHQLSGHEAGAIPREWWR